MPEEIFEPLWRKCKNINLNCNGPLLPCKVIRHFGPQTKSIRSTLHQDWFVKRYTDKYEEYFIDSNMTEIVDGKVSNA
jgi:hypothetical protein